MKKYKANRKRKKEFTEAVEEAIQIINEDDPQDIIDTFVNDLSYICEMLEDETGLIQPAFYEKYLTGLFFLLGNVYFQEDSYDECVPWMQSIYELIQLNMDYYGISYDEQFLRIIRHILICHTFSAEHKDILIQRFFTDNGDTILDLAQLHYRPSPSSYGMIETLDGYNISAISRVMCDSAKTLVK